MVKFCGVCGSQLNESGVCPKCGSAEQDPLTNEEPANVVYPRHKTVAADIGDTAAEKKNEDKLLIITAVMLALCVLSGGVFAAFSFNWFGLGKAVKGPAGKGAAASAAADNSRALPDEPYDEPDDSENVYFQAQPQAFVRSSYGKITGGLNLNLIHGAPCPEEQALIRTSGGKSISLQSDMASDGDVFYGFVNGGDDLRKVTLTGATSAYDEVWASAETMKNSVLGYSYEGEPAYAKDLENFTVDGDYVYARVAAHDTYREKHKALNYRLVKINKDSGIIELVGGENVRATCFLISEGWIYYADNGYTYSVEKNEYSYSERRVGLYKMRTDGSGKVLLSGSFSGYKGDFEGEQIGNAGGLSLCGGKLYYLFLENGKSFLWRMNTDGTQNERVSDISADNYAIDIRENTVFLRSGTYGAASSAEHSLYRLDLNTKASQPMNIKLRANTNRMTVSGGYLYVDDCFRDFENKRLTRIYIKNDNNSVQCLLKRSYSKIAPDAETGLEKRIEEKSPEYRWAEYRGDVAL